MCNCYKFFLRVTEDLEIVYEVQKQACAVMIPNIVQLQPPMYSSQLAMQGCTIFYASRVRKDTLLNRI